MNIQLDPGAYMPDRAVQAVCFEQVSVKCPRRTAREEETAAEHFREGRKMMEGIDGE